MLVLPIPPEPITLDGPDARRHRFRYDVSRLLSTGEILLQLGEGDFGPGYNASTGYYFAVAGPGDGSRFADQVRHVTEAARAAVGQLYLEEFDAGWHGKRTLLAGWQARGRLVPAGGPGEREPYNVVIDGRAISWEEFGRTLEPFEGYRFRLTLEEEIEQLPGQHLAARPPFDALFPPRPPAGSRDEEIVLTARNAAVLWHCACEAAEDARADLDRFGDTAIPTDEAASAGWLIFDEYPLVTYQQDEAWRRRARNAFLDLAGDLEDGLLPLPRCPAEELALHLMLTAAETWQDNAEQVEVDTLLAGLPGAPADDDWDYLREVLFRDHDILNLYDPEASGIEDPADPRNQMMSIGDYRPAAWFTTFADAAPRPRRSTPPV
jgi:hypothetical protein